MATEFPAGGLETYPIWLTERATDYLRGDIPNKGGLTTMLKTAHLAEAFDMKYEIHHSGNSLNNLANLHLCMAIRNTTMFEVLLPDGAHKYGMAKEIEIDKDGLLHAPDRIRVGRGDRLRPDQAQDRGGAELGWLVECAALFGPTRCHALPAMVGPPNIASCSACMSTTSSTSSRIGSLILRARQTYRDIRA